MRFVFLSVLWLLAALSASLSHASSSSAWPEVKPLDARIKIDLSSSMVDKRIPIQSVKGETLYWLRCIGGTTDQLDKAGDRDGENYVPPLACVLVERPDGWAGDLLAEDQSAIWYSRGQFHGPDLSGKCAAYPEFGLNRHFRLRHMLLTLTAEDVSMHGQEMAGLTLHVTVKLDPEATTSIAQRPGYIAPKSDNCGTPKRGTEPLKCRDEKTFSWKVCDQSQKRLMGYPDGSAP
jgi:hypothetical protein